MATKKKKKKVNLCVRGGESNGLAYFAPIKEMFQKGVLTGTAFLISAGVLMFVLYYCGYLPREIKALLKKLKCDFTMRQETKLETEKAPLHKKILAGLGIVFVVKTFWNRSMTKLLQQYVSWDMIKSAGRVDKVYIGFTTRRELKKPFPWYKPFFACMARLLSDKISERECERAYNESKLFWASDDGIYHVNTATGKMIKYSDDIIPLWEAVKCAIKNPAMNNFKISLNGKKEKPFDGGIWNNHGNQGYLGAKADSYYCLSCYPLPDSYFEGDSNFSDYVYNKNVPGKAFYFPPFKDDGFFAFNDKKIESEYLHAEPSNIF